jgi:alpha-tubulin suppressor-like RCC1 family protein
MSDETPNASEIADTADRHDNSTGLQNALPTQTPLRQKGIAMSRNFRISAVLLLATSVLGVLVRSAPATAAIPRTTVLAAGFDHSLVVKADGSLWAFGSNLWGQLGVATNVDTFVPTPTPQQVMSNVASVAAGEGFSLVLKTDGTLWSFGLNSMGQLGRSDSLGSTVTPNSVPTQILTGVSTIAAGRSHGLALLTNGTLMTFGSNVYGQLGTRAYSGSGTPIAVPTAVMTDVMAIAGGESHSLAVKRDGTLWSFGSNSAGQLGVADDRSGDPAHPDPVLVMSGVFSVSAGTLHSLALRRDGTLWTFGNNAAGQRGTPLSLPIGDPNPTEILSDVVAIAAGSMHSLAVKRDHSLWTFGLDRHGQLGRPGLSGPGLETHLPTKALEGITSAAGGFRHSLALTTTGVLLAFGVNTDGELGLPSNILTEQPNPQPTPALSSLANSGVPEPSAVPSSFVSLVPARLMDSRSGGSTVDGGAARSGVLAAGSTSELVVTGRGGVPVDSAAVVLNVTVVDARAPGFVTVFPCGATRPTASSLNYGTGATIPNAVISKVGANGKVCFYSQSAVDLIVDVTGQFPAVSSFVSLVPARLMDSRSGGSTADGDAARSGVLAAGSTSELAVTGRGGVPVDSAAVVLNVTVVDARAPGFVTVFPCGATRPTASSLNYGTGATIPNAVISKVGANGKVCFYSQSAVDLIVDVTGQFAI